MSDEEIESNIYDVFSDSPPDFGNNFIQTGIWQLDESLSGGLRKKELGTILAPWKNGKTAVLTILGANAYIKGKSVLHFLYEDYWADIQAKYKRILESEKRHDNCFLSLVDCVSETITLQKIEGLINERHPNTVIIDYGELIPTELHLGQTEKRHILKSIFVELRRIAGRTNTAIWTAHQSTIAVTQDRKPILRLTADRVSECKAIAATTDVLVGFTINDPFDQFLYCTIMKAKHRRMPDVEYFKLGVDFSQPRVWSL